jgi:hypothetical protein
VVQHDSEIGGFPVTDERVQEAHPAAHSKLLKRKSRVPRVLLIVAMLAMVAAALAYVGLNSENLIRTAFSRTPSAVGEADAEDKVTLQDLRSVQQKLTDAMQSSAQETAAQRDDLKRLSDQVAALAARVEAWQSAASPAPVQAAAPVQTAATALAAVSKPPPAIAPLKKRAAAKPTGHPVSVGGAPLPNAPAREEQ